MDFIVNLVTLALPNNNDDNIVSDDEENDDVNMPPLVEVDNQEVSRGVEPPAENPVAQSLYPVAMVNFEKNVDGKSVPPSLFNKDTGEVVDEVNVIIKNSLTLICLRVISYECVSILFHDQYFMFQFSCSIYFYFLYLIILFLSDD